jgi:hypothetical protein
MEENDKRRNLGISRRENNRSSKTLISTETFPFPLNFSVMFND